MTEEGTGGSELIRSLDHQLRRRILRLLEEWEEPLSPNLISKKLEEPLNNVSYHVGTLRNLRAVRKVSERQVRGALEHFYVSTVEDNEIAQTLLEETRIEDERLEDERKG